MVNLVPRVPVAELRDVVVAEAAVVPVALDAEVDLYVFPAMNGMSMHIVVQKLT